MVEYAAHVEAHDTMTGNTINIRHRMTERLADCCNAMAGIAAKVGNNGRSVIGIGAEKTDCCMAVAAFGNSIGMWGCRRFADGYDAVVATRARPVNSRMIVAAVRIQCQKAGGVVAVVALGVGRRVKLGFADRQNAIVTLAAIAKYFLVINIRNCVKTQWSMAGFAQTTGGDVIRRFPRDFARSR